jgi:hypothetical protein
MRGGRGSRFYAPTGTHFLTIGALAALIMSLIVFLFRSFGLTRICFEEGLGRILFQASSPWALGFGLAWHLANGAILAWLFSRMFKAREWEMLLRAFRVPAAFWFLGSMAVGTFSALTVWRGPNDSFDGLLGTLLGGYNFYTTGILIVSFGAAAGELMRSAAVHRQTRGPAYSG